MEREVIPVTLKTLLRGGVKGSDDVLLRLSKKKIGVVPPHAKMLNEIGVLDWKQAHEASGVALANGIDRWGKNAVLVEEGDDLRV